MTWANRLLFACSLVGVLAIVAPSANAQLVGTSPGLPPAIQQMVVEAVYAGDANGLTAIADANPAAKAQIADAIIVAAEAIRTTQPLYAAKAAIVALEILKDIPGYTALPAYGRAFALANVNPRIATMLYERGSLMRPRGFSNQFSPTDQGSGTGGGFGGSGGGGGGGGGSSENPSQAFGSNR